MSGYLEQKEEKDGMIKTWQTPLRQRYWGLGLSLIPAGMIIFAIRDLSQVNKPLLVAGSVLLLATFLVATWTVKFSLHLRYGTYEAVRGFIPFLFGERGRVSEAFQCVSVRAEPMLDAARYEDDPSAKSFDVYRVFLVWEDPRREAMLIDSCPASYQESLQDIDFHAKADAVAGNLADALGIPFLDQCGDITDEQRERLREAILEGKAIVTPRVVTTETESQ
ncbi:hypothetical protein QPK87_27885 [Kamptonema cortianum]|nr:hypothetical protein [Geitlerinema splendidum]MDK3160349.1 hypothetical protein [Kamptonema cortianum]